MNARVGSQEEHIKQNIRWFTHRFGPSYRKLARYAALPLVLTPELLTHLRSKYLRHEVSQEVEADLLLSDLCSQVGFEQYVMDTRTRAILLAEMRDEIGYQQMQDVARTVLKYVNRLGRTNVFINEHELQAQRCAVMAQLDEQHHTAVREIVRAFRSCGVLVELSESSARARRANLMRLVNIVEVLTPELKAHKNEKLLNYAQDVRLLLADPSITPETLPHSDQPVMVGELPLLPLTDLFIPKWPSWSLASDGLYALETLLLEPDVRAAATLFRDQFRAAYAQLDVIGECVNMLSQLDQLRYSCYVGIVQEARFFPNDDISSANIRSFDRQLEGIMRRMQEIADRTPAIAHPEWMPRLVQAHEHLHTASTIADAQELKQATALLRRVLDRYPSQILQQLYQAMRLADLPGLVSALELIREASYDRSTAAEQVQRFEDGIATLRTLVHHLNDLVQEHDAWHQIDMHLNEMADSLDHNGEMLVSLWKIVKKTGEPLYRDRGEAWATALVAEGERLDRAIGLWEAVSEGGRKELERAIVDSHLTRIKHAFRPYRSRVDARLFQITERLRALCDELRQLADPLADLLVLLEPS